MYKLITVIGIVVTLWGACSSSRQVHQIEQMRGNVPITVNISNKHIGDNSESVDGVGTFKQITMDQIKYEAQCPIVISTELSVSLNGIKAGMKRKDIPKTYLVKKTGILNQKKQPYYLIDTNSILIDALFTGDSIDDILRYAVIRIYQISPDCVVLNGKPVDNFTAASAVKGMVCYLPDYVGLYDMKWNEGCPEIEGVKYCNPLDFMKYVDKKLNIDTPEKIPFEGGTCLSGKYTVTDYNLDAGIVEVVIGDVTG